MDALAEAGLLLLAGFVLFCVPLAVVSWYTDESRRLWAATATWAVLTAALAIATVQVIATSDAPMESRGWFSLRHILIGLSLLAFFWVLTELAGYVPWVVLSLLALVLVVRDVLWFSTDLVWTGTFDAGGEAIYGPLRTPISVAIGLLALIGLIRTATRPWTSTSARALALWVLIPAVILGTIFSTLSGPVSELLMVSVFVFPILMIQATLVHQSTLHSRRLQRLRVRDTQLTDFAAQALAPGGVVPSRGAIDLLTSVLGEGRYAYFDLVEGERKLVAQSLGEPMSATTAAVVIPVQAKGRTCAELVVRDQLDEDDQMFVNSLGYVLSAAVARSEMERDAQDHTLHNSLTGLPNWLLLQDRLARLLATRADQTVAVWCCDVADMKAINDDSGHRAGDAVLKELGRRLRDTMGESATVAHIGADEYAIALLVADERQAIAISPRIAGIAHTAVEFEGRPLRFGVRVGLATASPDDAEADADRLIRDAELALMQAKRQGSLVSTYDAAARKEIDEARKVVRGLQRAIRDDEIYVDYQPILDLTTGSTVGLEALARWRTPSGDRVPPDVFIEAAENNGMIMSVTRRVFSQALGQLSDWGREHPDLTTLNLSLNLTPRVVVAPDLTGWLMEMLEEYEIDPSRVTLELTESAAISAPEAIISRMTELHSEGMSISLDDFGTGHSSFNRLMALLVDELKIDRMFTQGTNGPHQTIVPAVVGLARDTGLSVVAEGIETTEQLRILQGLDCNFGQGYLLSRPISPEQVPDFVAGSPELLRELSQTDSDRG